MLDYDCPRTVLDGPPRSRRDWSRRPSPRWPTRPGWRCARWCRAATSTRSWTSSRPSAPRRSWPPTSGSAASDSPGRAAPRVSVRVSFPPVRRLRMTHVLVLLLALLIGVVAGSAGADRARVVAWAALLGWINLDGTWAQWVAHPITVTVLTDPGARRTGHRSAAQDAEPRSPLQFVARLITGAFRRARCSRRRVLHPPLVALGAGRDRRGARHAGRYEAPQAAGGGQRGHRPAGRADRGRVAVLGGFAVAALAAVVVTR